MTRPTIDDLLREAGCPFPSDSRDAAIWAHGWKSGVEKGQAVLRCLALPIYTGENILPLAPRVRR